MVLMGVKATRGQVAGGQWVWTSCRGPGIPELRCWLLSEALCFHSVAVQTLLGRLSSCPRASAAQCEPNEGQRSPSCITPASTSHQVATLSSQELSGHPLSLTLTLTLSLSPVRVTFCPTTISH